MLTDLLVSDLITWLDAAPDGLPRRVLLWLDPEAQFARLVPYLEAPLTAHGVQLLRYAPEANVGQLALKLTLLQLEEDQAERAVVHLPGFGREALAPRGDGSAPPLWGLYDYRYKGCVWGLGSDWEPGMVPEPPTLLLWLRRHGLVLSDAKTGRALTAGGSDALLARYAEAVRHHEPREWPRPLRLSDVLATLGGDPRDTLRDFLAAPHNAVRQWGDDKPLKLERIRDEYGLPVPEGEVDAEALADGFAVALALTEAWDAFGRSADFPFLSRLPAKLEQRQRAIQFLREDVLSHTALRPRFLRRMRRLEPSCSLTAWATGRPGQPAALPGLAHTRWQQFLKRFIDAHAAGGWKGACDFLLGEQAAIDAAAIGPLDGPDSDTHWSVLRDVAQLRRIGSAATNEAQVLQCAADLVAAYVDRWWQTDQVHLRVRAACAEVSGLEEVRRVADLAYFDYVARVAERFTDLVECENAWPPSGTTSVENLRHTLWKSGSARQAVIFVDACRWNLAQGVAALLSHGNVTLTPVMSTLPSETAFGMTALLPLDGEPMTVGFKGTQVTIQQQGSGPDLAERQGRKVFLKATLPSVGNQSRVECVDMGELLNGASVPPARLVAVFDNTIDEQGEKGTEGLAPRSQQFIANIKRTIERLHAAGVDTVHLVTDHGFLLLSGEAVDAPGRPEVLPAQALRKDNRWAALKPGAPVADVISFPLPLAPEMMLLGFPRGVRTLEKASDYMHGGISLQECAIPHLVSFVPLPRARVGLDLSVSTNQLSGGTVPVIIRPVIPAAQPLGGTQPITVRLWVETAPGEGHEPREVSKPVDVELRPDVEELKPAVYLKEGMDLKANDRLYLRTIDTETGQSFDSLELTLLVDWE